MNFEVDQELFWLSGDAEQVATVLAVEEDRVQLASVEKTYWIKKTVLIKKIENTYPSNSNHWNV